MRNILRYILFILFLFTGIANNYAQTKNIYLKFVGDKEGQANIDVYSFRYKLEAEKATARLKRGESLDKQHDNYIAKTQTGKGANKGRARINVPNNGWLIFDFDFQQYTISIADAKVVDNEYIFELKQASEGMFQKMDDKVNIRGRQRIDDRKTVPGEGSTCNGLLYIKPYPVIIDSVYAHNNARFVLSPVVVSRNNPKDTIGFLPPRVLDGIDYNPSQVRYTGFDQINIGDKPYNKNDYFFKNKDIIGEEPMSNIFNKGMRTREQDTIYFQCKIRPYDDKNPWKIIGHCWYEDYNTVYYERNVLLYAGYTTKPSEFLDWRSSIPEEDIDASHYSIEARTEAITTPMELRLDFKSGEATLNYADSLTMANLNSIESRIQSILNNDNAEFHGISLLGYASPEGRETTNQSLAQKRTETVRDYLKQRFSYHLDVKSLDKKIVTWEEVADTIEALNNTKYADIVNEIRDICKRKSTLDAQYYDEIRFKNWYSWVHDSILPRMRRVRIETEYVEQKELSSKEIFQRYENEATKAPFIEGSAPAYQYYQLMSYLYDNQDWDALHQIAQVVYNVSKEAVKTKDEGNQLIDITEHFTTVVDSIIPIKIEVRDSLGKKSYQTKDSITYAYKREPIIRPYPLAAYYLAKCKLEKGEITAADTMLLKDYLDDSNQGLYYDKVDFDGAHHYWNEEAIVITQILIHCAIEDFSRARFLSLYHLPKDGKYETFQSFLKFLSCDEDEDKEHTRRLIEETSPNNYVVANLTKDVIDGEIGFVRALKELEENKDAFLKDDTLDATYYYLLAICKYKKENPRQDYEVYYYDSRTAYDPNPESLMNWGAPMLEAFRLDPKWVDFLKEDGYFNDAYRSMMLYFWQRMKDGVRMADIAKEYDELAKKYFSDKK